MIDVIEATKIAREYLKDNIRLNLMLHSFTLHSATMSKDGELILIHCSLVTDFDETTHYYFKVVRDTGKLIRFGIGKLEGDTLILKEHKVIWREEATA